MKSLSFLSFFLVVSWAPVSQAQSQETILKEMRETTVLTAVYGSGDEAFTGECSGVWVGKNHMITANHCLKNSSDIEKTVDEKQLRPLYQSQKFYMIQCLLPLI